MIDAKTYTVTVQFGNYDGDDCFEARVREFPEIREYADTFEEAYQLAVDTIGIICEHTLEKGLKCPAPLVPNDEYSGRVTLRLPISLHQKLAADADLEGISLNQQIVNLLCYAQGMHDGSRALEMQAEKVAARFEKALVITYDYRSSVEHRVGMGTGQAQPLSGPSQLYPNKKMTAEKAYH
jgi:predicted HicB family RNase H-like nuclease